MEARLVEEIIGRPRALRALIALRQIEPRGMTAGDLQRATGYTVKSAVQLRNDLHDWGLIQINEAPGGRLPTMEICLTPAGREVADLATKAEAAAKKARKQKRNG